MTQQVPVFQSFLGPTLLSYLQWRQGLGYKDCRTQLIHLRDFDHYLLFYGVSNISQIDEGLLVQWLHAVPSRSPGTKNNRLKTIRGFCRYLVRAGMAREDASSHIAYLKENPRLPYIYTLKELAAILEQARQRQRSPRHRFAWQVMETLIYLTYACGLRISEALNLRIEDINFQENTLSIWKTKFNKERLLPFSHETKEQLKNYLLVRNGLYPQGDKGYVFCHSRGRYSYNTIKTMFKKLLAATGFLNGKGRNTPCFHSLRHAFAVHRLYKWYQEDKNILNKLPLLSCYMGHVDIENTRVYITVTRMLLREGNRRFREYFEGMPANLLKKALTR